MINNDNPAGGERRVHHAVRSVFPRVCVLLAPLMKNSGKALGASGFAMVHMVQDHFPELSTPEVRIVISTIECLHREDRLQALLEQLQANP